MKKQLAAILVFVFTLIIVFPSIKSGMILHNCVYKYHFEPWAHHKNLIGAGLENPIISDSMDGADANLTPYNVSLLSVGQYLQVYKQVSAALSFLFSGPTALAILYWLTFALCFFALSNFLAALGVPTLISFALSIGFTFGATNNHFYAYGTLTTFGVTCFWFLERLIQTRQKKWLILLTLALVNLGGAEMVHIAVFYSFSLFAYAVFRLSVLAEHRKETFLLVGISFFFSLAMSIDYIYPTAYHYLFNFDKGYREGYGILQSSPVSFSTLFYSRIFGDPILEQRRWPTETFLSSSLFIGSLAAFSLAAIFAPQSWPKKRLGCFLFFLVAALLSAVYQYRLPYENFELVLAKVPPFKWVPPLYFKAVFHFFLIVLAAFSLTSIYEGSLGSRGRRILALLITPLPLLASIWVFHKYYLLNGPSTWTINFFQEASIFIALNFAALCVLIFGGRRVKSIACVALVILAAFEARANTRGWFPRADPRSCYPRTAVTDFLIARNDGARIQGLGRAAIPAIISRGTYGLETAMGRMPVSPGMAVLLQQIDPLAYKNHPTQYLFAESSILDHPVWELLNVRFFIARKAFTQEEAQHIGAGNALKFNYLSDGLVIERATTSSPAVLRTSCVPAEDEPTMARLLDNGYDWQKNVVVEPADLARIENFCLSGQPNNPQSKVFDYQKATNLIKFRVQQTSPGILVLSERWDSLWTVTVDDQPIAAVRTYFSLLGVPVGPGEHTITLRYQLPGLWIAIWATLGAILAFLILTLLLCRRERSIVLPTSPPGATEGS